MNNRKRGSRTYNRRTMDGHRAYENPHMESFEDNYYRNERPDEYRQHDYYPQNFWHGNSDGRYSQEYVPEFNYGPRRDNDYYEGRRGQHTSGYGNENSQYMHDFDRRMGKSSHRDEYNGYNRNNERYEYHEPRRFDNNRAPLSDESDHSYRFSRRRSRNEDEGSYSRNGNDNGGRSYIDKQEGRNSRGYDNEDSYDRGRRPHRDNGGFNRDSGFHLFDRENSRSRRPNIRDRR